MKKVDVIYLVEHIDRELDVAAAVKYLAKKKYNFEIEIFHIYLHANFLLEKYRPKVAVFPFFYKSSDLALSEYVKYWKNTIFVNLAWEQIHYRAHLKIKAPGDTFTRKKVVHHAWGAFYEKFLLDSDVPQDNVFRNGNPAYQLYLKPYRNYFFTRQDLARKYNLREHSRWIFIPENYRWAFINDAKIDKLVKSGSNKLELINMRKFCKKSIQMLLKYSTKFAKENQNFDVVFRPRPATMKSEIQNLIKTYNIKLPPNFHLLKDESVREWIISSDVIISSFSTSLIEASIVKKEIFMFMPINIPSALHCEWYKNVTKIKDYDDFEKACFGKKSGNSQKLSNWTDSEMHSVKDPIINIAHFLSKLVEEKKQRMSLRSVYIDYIYRIFFIFSKKKDYFNSLTHEKDFLNIEEINKRTYKWSKILSKF